jgi:hypothetical protein
MVSLEMHGILEVMFGSAVKFRALRVPRLKLHPLTSLASLNPESQTSFNLTSLASCISPHRQVVVCSIPLPSSKIKIFKTRRVSLQSQPTAGDVGDKSNTESIYACALQRHDLFSLGSFVLFLAFPLQRPQSRCSSLNAMSLHLLLNRDVALKSADLVV